MQELKSNIIAFAKEADNPTLAGFLDEVALYTCLLYTSTAKPMSYVYWMPLI